MQVSNAFLLLHIFGFLFKRLLQSAHAFRSKVVLQNGASCCCCGAHQWTLGPLNAQLDVTLTPALGELSPQFLCLCMACWKSDSDYLQYRFSMPNNVRLKSQWKRCTRIIMNPLYTWVNSRKKQNKTALHVQCCRSYVGITSWTKHVSSLPSFRTRLPWQPPRHHTLTSFQGVHNNTIAKKNKEWCTRYSSNAPLWWQGWLWAHAMESVDRIRSTVTGSNKQRFSFVMMPILSNLHCKFVTWLGFLFQQGTNL